MSAEEKKPSSDVGIAVLTVVGMAIAIPWLLEIGPFRPTAKPVAAPVNHELEGSPRSDGVIEQLVAAEAPQKPRSQYVSREDFESDGKTWPLKTEGGSVMCFTPRLAIFVDENDGKAWGLNGPAFSRYPAIDPLWSEDPNVPGAKRNISDLLKEALRLCPD